MNLLMSKSQIREYNDYPRDHIFDKIIKISGVNKSSLLLQTLF